MSDLSEQASGYIKGDGNGNFEARFTLSNGVVKTLNGRFSSAVPYFNAPVSLVRFNQPGDLSGTYDIGANATVGPTTVNLPFVNNGTGTTITLTGNLNPFMAAASTATGSGSWSSS